MGNDKKWKTIAIIFIVLFSLLLLFSGLFYIGSITYSIELDCKIQCLEAGYSYSDLTGEGRSCNCEGYYLTDTSYGKSVYNLLSSECKKEIYKT